MQLWAALAASHPAVPGQRLGGETAAVGQETVASQETATGRETVVGGAAMGQPIPAQAPAPEPETAAARGRHARPTLDGAGDFRRDAAEADWRTDAPTRPDLPAQGAPTGRHSMPVQRSGEPDRAERSLAGPDADRADDEPGQE